MLQDAGRTGALSPPIFPGSRTIVDIGDKTCLRYRQGLPVIGDDVAERLDMVPVQFRVIVIDKRSVSGALLG